VTASVLIIGIGNPSRGDDALGPLAIERLAALDLPGVEFLIEFQLQVEFALDITGRERVVFIDAAASGPEPYAFHAPLPGQQASHSTHALTPESVLAACHQVGVPLPAQAWVLAIRGYEFELGAALSPEAEGNLRAALAHLEGWLTTPPAPSV